MVEVFLFSPAFNVPPVLLGRRPAPFPAAAKPLPAKGGKERYRECELAMIRSFRPFILLLGTLSLALAVHAQAPDAATVASVDRQLLEETRKQETALLALSKLDPSELDRAVKAGPGSAAPDPMPPIFRTFQTGWFTEKNVYMSEVKHVKEMLAAIAAVKTRLPGGGKGLTITDFAIALHRSSPDHKRSSGNGCLVLDTLYNIELVDDL